MSSLISSTFGTLPMTVAWLSTARGAVIITPSWSAAALAFSTKLLTLWASRTEGEGDQNDDSSEYAHDSHGLLLLYGAMANQLKTSVSAYPASSSSVGIENA